MKKVETMCFEALVHHLQGAPWHQDIFVVALEGRSGSGKTTLTHRLARSLGAQVLHGDDFYRIMPEDQRAALTPEQGYEQYFEWQRLRAELATLRNGSSTSFLPYSWTDDPPRQVSLCAEGWLIVEGVYTLHPELRHLYDLKVYVDLPEELRRVRLSERSWDDLAWVQRWEAAEDWYHRHHNPRSAADVVISGAGQ
ncbi:uridine kinase [Deinococcus sp. NW-56]|uniref:uridine kinase family protein n=1 Tax=Deinococcus sp. NW-56 TaxID=2080419 RepID=UPI00131A2D4D|nr:AAA family ATPase [Deinococcus sp. NW-56]